MHETRIRILQDELRIKRTDHSLIICRCTSHDVKFNGFQFFDGRNYISAPDQVPEAIPPNLIAAVVKMRGKRSKQYRKLMQQYGLNFGIREPFQVLSESA